MFGLDIDMKKAAQMVRLLGEMRAEYDAIVLCGRKGGFFAHMIYSEYGDSLTCPVCVVDSHRTWKAKLIEARKMAEEHGGSYKKAYQRLLEESTSPIGRMIQKMFEDANSGSLAKSYADWRIRKTEARPTMPQVRIINLDDLVTLISGSTYRWVANGIEAFGGVPVGVIAGCSKTMENGVDGFVSYEAFKRMSARLATLERSDREALTRLQIDQANGVPFHPYETQLLQELKETERDGLLC